MHVLEIPHKNIVLKFASCWGELDKKQALYASSLLYMVQKGQLDPFVFKKLMIDRLLNRKNNAIKPDLFAVNQENIDTKKSQDAANYWTNEAKLCETMDFFFQEIKPDKKKGKKKHEPVADEQIKLAINTNFVVNVIKTFRGYIGPEDLLQNCTFLEFKDCVSMLCKYAETKDDNYLFQLATILYRKKKSFLKIRRLFGTYNGDDRIQYKQYSLKKNNFNQKHIGFAFYVFLFFASCMDHIKTKPIEIDGKQYCFDVLFKRDGAETSSDDTGLTGILFSLAENGTFGDVDKTANANLFDVLLALYRSVMQAKQLESK